MISNLLKARTIHERRNQCVHDKRIETAPDADADAVGSSQHVVLSK
jgi:hypothetical protein